jgi:hypothetical protein
MKCSNHAPVDAVAACVFCGQGLCSTCITRSSSGRVVCSPRCAGGIAELESAIAAIHQKTLNGYRLLAYLCFAAAALFISLGIYEIVRAQATGRWAMAVFVPIFGLVFIAIGIGALRLVKSGT